MKKIFILLAVLALALSILACGTTTQQIQVVQPTATHRPAPTATPRSSQSFQQNVSDVLEENGYIHVPDLDYTCSSPCQTYLHSSSGVLAQVYPAGVAFAIDLDNNSDTNAAATYYVWQDLYPESVLSNILDCMDVLSNDPFETCTKDTTSYFVQVTFSDPYLTVVIINNGSSY